MSKARCITIVGSLYALMRQMLSLNVATPLGAQELSATIAPDRPLVVLGHEPIAGFAHDHGTVANEAAMLALHTLDSTTLLVEPTFVAPGDSVLRADDPGWRWHCLRGHGQSLTDWERRPLGGALEGLATSGHTHAISAITGLQSALDGKQAALANAATVARLSSVPTGPLLFDGVEVGGGTGGGTVSPLVTAAINWNAACGVWDAAGVLPSDGGVVSRWDDATGNGAYLTAVAAPTYRANGFGSGIPAVEFDGIDDSMQGSYSTALLSRASGFEMLAVIARLSTALDTLLLTASWGDRLDCVVNHSSGSPAIFDYYDYDAHRLLGAIAAFETTSPMVVGFRFDGGRMAISMNGVDQLTKLCTSNASLGSSSATITLGRHGPWSYAQGNCRIGRLLVWDHALSVAARAAAVGELRAAFGI